jgi:hypothetical protein
MADTYTSFLNLTKPEVGASRDTWGDKYNANFQALDTWAKGTDDALKSNITLANTKVAKAGDAMTGDLLLNKSYPSVQFQIPDGTKRGWQMSDADKQIRWVDYTTGNPEFSIANGGAVWTKQLGDLKTYVDTGVAAATAARGDRVAKGGDTMTGALQVSGDFPQLRFQRGNKSSGYGWYAHTDDRVYLQKYNADGSYNANLLNVGPNGELSTAPLGDLGQRIETRAQAWADDRLTTARGEYNQKVAKSGDTMTGNLIVNKAYPAVNLYYYNVLAGSWIIDSDARMKFRNTDNGDIYWSVGTAGDMWCKQFGDVNTRIEQRAADFANDRLATARAEYGQKLPLGGGQLTGNLTIAKAWPEIQLLWGGVYRWSILGMDNAELSFRNGDDGDPKFKINNGGGIWTRQLGDLYTYIENRGAQIAEANGGYRFHAARLVFQGDLNMNWGPGGMNSPYGGNVVITDRWSYDPWGNGLYIDYAKRFRTPQMYANQQGWVSFGLA